MLSKYFLKVNDINELNMGKNHRNEETTCFMVVIGEIKTRRGALISEAKYAAGPLPIDLPIMVSFYNSKFLVLIKWLKNYFASALIRS